MRADLGSVAQRHVLADVVVAVPWQARGLAAALRPQERREVQVAAAVRLGVLVLPNLTRASVQSMWGVPAVFGMFQRGLGAFRVCL